MGADSLWVSVKSSQVFGGGGGGMLWQGGRAKLQIWNLSHPAVVLGEMSAVCRRPK